VSEEVEFETDPTLLVCLNPDTGKAYLPLSEYAPLIHQLEALQAKVNNLLERMAQIHRLAEGP
jgi:hypothetical protein